MSDRTPSLCVHLFHLVYNKCKRRNNPAGMHAFGLVLRRAAWRKMRRGLCAGEERAASPVFAVAAAGTGGYRSFAFSALDTECWGSFVPLVSRHVSARRKFTEEICRLPSRHPTPFAQRNAYYTHITYNILVTVYTIREIIPIAL